MKTLLLVALLYAVSVAARAQESPPAWALVQQDQTVQQQLQVMQQMQIQQQQQLQFMQQMQQQAAWARRQEAARQQQLREKTSGKAAPASAEPDQFAPSPE